MSEKILAYDDGEGGFKKSVFFPDDGSGFKIVTIDTDGACLPCQCEDDTGCFVKVIPCQCDREDEAMYITSSQAIEFWPNRPTVGVIEVSGTCYRWYGERLYNPPQSKVLDISSAIEHQSCATSPCSEQLPCPPCTGGFGTFVGVPITCVPGPGVLLSCVGRATISGHAFGTYRTSPDSLGRETIIRMGWSASYTWEVLPGQTSFTRIASSYHSYWFENNANGSSRRGLGSYSGIDAPIVFGPEGFNTTVFGLNGIGTNAIFQSPDLVVTSSGGTVVETGGTLGFGVRRDGGIGCDVREYIGPGANEFIDRLTLDVSGSMAGQNISISKTAHLGSQIRETHLHINTTHEYTLVGDLVDSTPAEREYCPYPRYAVACSETADPQQITYDARNLPEWAVSATHPETDEIYILTGLVSEDQPLDGVLVGSDECENQTMMIGQLCGGNDLITFDPDTRPADGITMIHNGDQYEPTNVPSASDIDTYVWSTDPCPTVDCSIITGPLDPRCNTNDYRDCPECRVPTRCAGITIDDPRCDLAEYRDCPQCFDGTGIDDPIIGPNDNQSNAPGLGDRIASAIDRATLGKIKPCAGCKRRQDRLNRIPIPRRKSNPEP
jgi:hypothetical protein